MQKTLKPHRSRQNFGPLAIALLGLTIAGGVENVQAGTYLVTSTGSLRTVQTRENQTMTAGVVTNSTGNLGNQDDAEHTYSWEWDGLGTAPNATFTQNADLTITPVYIQASTGAYASAGRDVRIGLYDPSNNDSAYNGNPTPFSDYKWISSGPDTKTGTGSDMNIALSAILVPTNYYGTYTFSIKVKTSSYSLPSLSEGNAPPGQASGTANGNLQKVTRTTETLIY